MNKKILEAFAQEIRQDFQAMPRRCFGKQYTKRKEQVNMVSRIAKRFNPRFDEQRFQKACGL